MNKNLNLYEWFLPHYCNFTEGNLINISFRFLDRFIDKNWYANIKFSE